jgi:hypothetical protein
MRGITLKNVWSDENLVEFEITTSDGCSTFCVKVYAGLQSLETLAADLERFAPNVFGGICDIESGCSLVGRAAACGQCAPTVF